MTYTAEKSTENYQQKTLENLELKSSVKDPIYAGVNNAEKPNAMIFTLGKKLTKNHKADIKNIVDFHWEDNDNAWSCEIEKSILVEAYLSSKKFEFTAKTDYVEYHSKTPEEKKIQNLGTSLCIKSKEVVAVIPKLQGLIDGFNFLWKKELMDTFKPISVKDIFSATSETLINLATTNSQRHIDHLNIIFEEASKLQKKQKEVSGIQLKVTQKQDALSNFDKVVKSLIRNERGDAELFLTTLKDKYLFDSTEGRSGEFYLWTGTHWKLDREKKRYKDMELVSDIYEKASIEVGKDLEVGKDKEKKDLADLLNKRAFNLRSAKRCKSVFEFISTEIHLDGEWDYCPEKLPCLNGILDLKTGRLLEHNPESLIRSVCPTSYNLEAKRPLFDKFLDDITLGNVKLKSFLGRVLGSALLGTCKEEKIFIFYGKDGRNGKGTLMQTLEKILGPIAKTFPSEMLLLQRNPPSSSTPRPEKANLQGVRLAIFSEIDEKRQIDASEVKNLSGGDTITCRRLFSNVDIQIKPSHTMFIQTNFKPKASAKDGALWKRNILVPFNAEFVAEPKKPYERKIDEGFKEKLLLEREGILAWLIEGCLEYQKMGLAIPEIVKKETENYRKENDGIQLFIEEKCTLDPALSTPCSTIQKAVKEYCKDQGHTIPNEREISSWMRDRFGEPKKTSRGTSYIGVSVNREICDEEVQ